MTSEMRLAFCIATSGYTDDEKARRAEQLKPWLPAGVSLDIVVVPDGPRFLDEASDFDRAVDAASAFLGGFQADQYDALISAGAIDPGLSRFRELSTTPVIGPGEAAMFLASILRLRLSIVTVDEHAVRVANELVASLALKPEVVSVRSIGMPVRQIVDNLPAARSAVLREATAAVKDDGAEAIYLGAVTLGTLGVDDQLRSRLGVAVLNPIPISIAAAVQCAATRKEAFYAVR